MEETEKIIIENKSGEDWETVLICVKHVMKQGLISETSKGKQYCFTTQFSSPNVVVWADRNKRSHRFVVEKNRHGSAS